MRRLQKSTTPVSYTHLEIAAAAVARGIENPGKKTSEITLHMGISDWLIMILVTFGIFIVVIAG